jgi:hypothetical protein
LTTLPGYVYHVDNVCVSDERRAEIEARRSASTAAKAEAKAEAKVEVKTEARFADRVASLDSSGRPVRVREVRVMRDWGGDSDGEGSGDNHDDLEDGNGKENEVRHLHREG